jgi:hypothetical protein
VADYNTTTAQAIASSGGYVNTLLGTIMPLVPIVLPYLAVLFLIYRRLVLSVLSFLAALCVSPTKLPPLTSSKAFKLALNGYGTWIFAHVGLITATFVVLLGIGLYVTKEIRSSFRAEVVRSLHKSGKSVHQAADDHGVSESALRSWADGGTGGVAVTLFLAVSASALLLPYFWYIYPVPRTLSYYKALVAQPWLPPERITAESGSPVIGYVLSASDTWVTILNARTRTIQYDPAAQVTSRLVCQLPSGNLGASTSSALVPLFKATNSKLPPCLAPTSRGIPSTMPQPLTSEWTVRNVTTASAGFHRLDGLGPLTACETNLATATLSVELSGAPAGFRIKVDGGRLMRPGAIRFVPVGTHDSFSFTFTARLGASRQNNRRTFIVEWRSPTRTATTLERATLLLQYQTGSPGC